MSFIKLCEELTKDIKDSYESGVTMEGAENLAAKFLYAQIQVSEELKSADLDSRMRKSGLKAIKAALYMEAATKTDKKPSDSFLENLITTDKIVSAQQNNYDESECNKEELERYYNIFREAHIYFRGIAKGRFE